MTFLIADGVVPSNEERGYVLRRVMRRAIVQGRHTLGMQPGFLVRYAERVRELMGASYPELAEQRTAVEKWLGSEEESFGRTFEQGIGMLRFLIDHAREKGLDHIHAEDAFKLHDTFGFPFELTRELLGEEGLSVDEAGFQGMMAEQRARSRRTSERFAAVLGPGRGSGHEKVSREQASRFAAQSPSATRFTGYEAERQTTSVAALERLSSNGGADGDASEGERVLLKLSESPFYPAGGGQVSDDGVIECEQGDCRARVEDVFRLGEDQALAVVVERGRLRPDEHVVACVDHAARRATERNHTATHLLHAALRARLGSHVRQAGSYVGPDKLRFDFSHSSALAPEELRDVEDQVNAWIAQGDPVRPMTTTLDEAKRLGAMALFGEKYGEIVRMVEIGEGEYSRELCGGTHVQNTAEIGAFLMTGETSSAANVRRIEALTGPAAVELLRERLRTLEQAAATLRTRPEKVAEVVREREATRRSIEKAAGTRAERVPELLSGAAAGGGPGGGSLGGIDAGAIAQAAERIDGVPFVGAEVQVPDAKMLLEVTDRVKGKLEGEGVIVLGAAVQDRASLVVSVAPSLVEKGLKAGAIVKAAAEVVGGGGGGRDTMAQAGGRNPEKLDQAIAVARAAVENALGARVDG